MNVALEVEMAKKNLYLKRDREISADLFGERLAFEWNEPVWKKVSEEFLKKYGNIEPMAISLEKERSEKKRASAEATWDIDDPSAEKALSDKEAPEKERPESDEIVDETAGDTPLPSKGRDYEWVWFIPAHASIENFGIWFSAPRTRFVIDEIEELLKKQKINDRTTAVTLALFMGFWQCCAHGWIESLCSIAETTEYASDVYTQTWRNNSNGIRMENAIAATLTNGMARMFFQSRHDKDGIFAAMGNLYNAIGYGYEKYSKSKDLAWWPTYRPAFQKNIFLLLSHSSIYGIAKEVARYSIGRFFEPSAFLFPNLKKNSRSPLASHMMREVPSLEPLYYNERYPITIVGA